MLWLLPLLLSLLPLLPGLGLLRLWPLLLWLLPLLFRLLPLLLRLLPLLLGLLPLLLWLLPLGVLLLIGLLPLLIDLVSRLGIRLEALPRLLWGDIRLPIGLRLGRRGHLVVIGKDDACREPLSAGVAKVLTGVLRVWLE